MTHKLLPSNNSSSPSSLPPTHITPTSHPPPPPHRELIERKKEERAQVVTATPNVATTTTADGKQVIIEYVDAPLPQEVNDLAGDDADLKRAFTRFLGTGDEEGDEAPASFTVDAGEGATPASTSAPYPHNDPEVLRDEETKDKLTNKARKAALRAKVAALKQSCARPDVVEIWDASAADPALLVHLKSYRNTVPVPRHWSQKRAYLQGKKGLEKPPFALPEYINRTGIMDMRDTYKQREEEAGSRAKQSAKARMRPKMGKVDIDYEILRDAFFVYQTKPKLTKYGDLYYEGKEFELKPEGVTAGYLSPRLEAALGLTAEGGPPLPPPWLRAMQRYGPPPAYPHLKIPGLNAPLPHGAKFGYGPGEWGKPPVDPNTGQPVYGDVFRSTHAAALDQATELKLRDAWRSHPWGAFTVVEEDEPSDSSSPDEDDDEHPGADLTPEDEVAGTASVATTVGGLETPSLVDLRKVPASLAPTPVAGRAESTGPKQLYTVLEQKKSDIGRGDLVGSEHVYVMPGKGGASTKSGITVDPSELEGLDDQARQDLLQSRLLEEQMRQQGGGDLRDMVAERAAQQAKKRESARAKKDEEKFKF